MNIVSRTVMTAFVVGYAVLLSMLSALPANAAPKASGGGLAFTGVKAGEGFTKGEMSTVDELFLDALSRKSPIRVVGSSDLSEMLGFEQQKQLLGCDESSCMVEIAGAMGVDYVATATLGKLSGITVITLKIIRVDKAVVVARATEQVAPQGSLIDAVSKVVGSAFQAAAIVNAAMPATAASATGTSDRDEVAGGTKRRWPWFVGAALAIGAGVAIDRLPASSHNQRFDGIDLVPVVLYGAGLFSAWEGI